LKRRRLPAVLALAEPARPIEAIYGCEAAIDGFDRERARSSILALCDPSLSSLISLFDDLSPDLSPKQTFLTFSFPSMSFPISCEPRGSSTKGKWTKGVPPRGQTLGCTH